MPWTNTGPITAVAANDPMMGHRGPVHRCSSSIATPADPDDMRHTTSIPDVMPWTWRYRISRDDRFTVISDTHQVGHLTGPKGRQAAISTRAPVGRRSRVRTHR